MTVASASLVADGIASGYLVCPVVREMSVDADAVVAVLGRDGAGGSLTVLLVGSKPEADVRQARFVDKWRIR